MLVKNIDVKAGLVNGSRGVVVGFSTSGLPTVRFRSGAQHTMHPENWTVSGREILPLRLLSLQPHSFTCSCLRFRNRTHLFAHACAFATAQHQVQVGVGRSASRRQVPLVLAWGISIHKSQGMTLDAVRWIHSHSATSNILKFSHVSFFLLLDVFSLFFFLFSPLPHLFHLVLHSISFSFSFTLSNHVLG